MLTRFPALLLAIAVASSTFAFETPRLILEDQPILKIVGKDVSPAGMLVRLKADGLPMAATVRWRVSPSKGVDRATTAPDLLEFVAPAGRYDVEVLAVVVKDGAPVILEATKAVTVGQPSPPTPQPPTGVIPAIGRLRFGGAGCTAQPIQPRRADGRYDVLTAAHCVPGPGSRGSITMRDGRTLAVTVVAVDRPGDLAWLVTERADVDDLPMAALARSMPEPGTMLCQSGFGVSKPGNTECGALLRDRGENGKFICRVPVSSGDSGGAIYVEATGEVVGTVYGTYPGPDGTRTIGGGCVRAWALRPKAGEVEPLEPEPLPLPCESRQEGTGQPGGLLATTRAGRAGREVRPGLRSLGSDHHHACPTA